MRSISDTDPLGLAVVTAIRGGNVEELRGLLADNSGLATARIVDIKGVSRTLMHIVSDWPGHYPDGAATVRVLAAAGAEVNARLIGANRETPLHWAASTDDVAVLDALLDAGADIEADGSVLGGGTPLKNATGFQQWKVARRLVERGAVVDLASAASLGLMDRIEAHFSVNPPEREQISLAFWYACHGGSTAAARYLLAHGADPNWPAPWDSSTPLDAAIAAEATELITWLPTQGANTATT